jgi:hypothetical protein
MDVWNKQVLAINVCECSVGEECVTTCSALEEVEEGCESVCVMLVRGTEGRRINVFKGASSHLGS